jgi:RHS repeat-associated protein
VILRDRDADTAWEDEADGTLEERVYYCQNWRADVVALFSDTGHMLQQVRYDPYGVPFGISKADLTADGVLDSNDQSRFTTLYNSGSGTHPFADWNLDGTLSSLDLIAYGNSYTGDVALGYGVLGYAFSRAGGANRKAYAGYEIDPVLTGSNGRESIYHVRHRVLLAELGRWNRRDPLGYVDGMSLYGYVDGKPIRGQDPHGTAAVPETGCGNYVATRSRCQDGDRPPVQPEIPKEEENDNCEEECPSNWTPPDWESCLGLGFGCVKCCNSAGAVEQQLVDCVYCVDVTRCDKIVDLPARGRCIGEAYRKKVEQEEAIKKAVEKCINNCERDGWIRPTIPAPLPPVIWPTPGRPIIIIV